MLNTNTPFLGHSGHFALPRSDFADTRRSPASQQAHGPGSAFRGRADGIDQNGQHNHAPGHDPLDGVGGAHLSQTGL